MTENINDNINQEKNKIHLCTESIEKGDMSNESGKKINNNIVSHFENDNRENNSKDIIECENMKDNNNLEKNKINLYTQSIEKGDISSNNENNITKYFAIENIDDNSTFRRQCNSMSIDNKLNKNTSNLNVICKLINNTDTNEKKINYKPYNNQNNNKKKMLHLCENKKTYSIGMKRNVEDNKHNYEVNNIQNIKRIRVDNSDSYEREKKVTKENISHFEPYNSHYNDKNKIPYYEIKKTDHTNEINKDGNIMINDNKDTNNIILIILKA